MNNSKDGNHESRSVLSDLRRLMPRRRLRLEEAKRVAELQANRLLDMLLPGATPPHAIEAATVAIPHLSVQYVRTLPSEYSGRSTCTNGRWLIEIDAADAEVRQRFTLAHELKHIVDHVHEQVLGDLYVPSVGVSSPQRREQLAHYFAACLLMPKRHVKRLWGEGEHSVGILAGQFEVSQEAMLIRLVDLGLVEASLLRQFRAGQAAIRFAMRENHRRAAAPTSRISRPIGRRRYHRTRSSGMAASLPQEVTYV